MSQSFEVNPKVESIYDPMVIVQNTTQKLLLENIFRIYVRPISKTAKTRIVYKSSIIWPDVKYESEDIYINSKGEHIRFIEYYLKNLQKYSIEYYKNDEIVSRMVWWPGGALKNISTCENGRFIETSYKIDGQIEYIVTHKLHDQVDRISLKL